MRYKTTVILAFVVIALAVLIILNPQWLKKPTEPASPVSGQGLSVLKDVVLADVSAATLEEAGPGGTVKTKVAFKRDGAPWRLTAPADYAANGFEVDRLVRGVTEGKYRQAIDAQADGKSVLPALGLEPAAYRLILTIAAKDKTPERTVTVALGKRTAVGEGMYVRVDDAPKVLVLDHSDLLAAAREEPDAFRGRELFSLARDDIVRIDIAGPKGKVQLDVAAGGDRSRWVLAQPLVGRADPDAVSNLFRAALSLQAKDFISDDPKNLATYGLADPALTVTLWKAPAPAPGATGTAPGATGTAPGATGTAPGATGTAPGATGGLPASAPVPAPVKVATLRFGGPADPRQATSYFLTDDGRHVVTVDATAMKNLDKTADNLRDKRVLEVNTARVTRLSLQLPAKLLAKGEPAAFDLVKSNMGWQIASAGGRTDKANVEAVNQLLQELANLKVMSFAEGDNAVLAKTFAPAGGVTLTVEGAAAPVGFNFNAPGALVKNLHEDWVGYVNTAALKALRKDWIDYVDTQIFSFTGAAMTGIEIQSADRKEVLVRTGEKWRLTSPIESDVNEALMGEILKTLMAFRAERYLAVATDFKSYGLEPGQLVITVTLAPAKAGDPPTKKVLHLMSDEKAGKCQGRIEGSDLVFSVAPQTFGLLAAEPVNAQMTAMSEYEVNRFDLTSVGQSLVLTKSENKWFRANAAGDPADEVSADVVHDLVDATTDLRASRWASYDAKDPAAFGLDKPALRIKVTGDRSSLTILVSDKTVPEDVTCLLEAPPARYAMTEDGKRIGIISGHPANVLITALEMFAPKKEPAPTATEK